MSDSDADDHEPAQVGHGNTHRALLQALLSRQTITFQEAKPILAAIETAAKGHNGAQVMPEDISQEDFENYVYALNEQISPFDFEIRSTRHQATKEVVYALVNVTSDALTQLATMHSADEIAFVKRVLDVMFIENNTQRREILAVTSIQALKCAKPSAEAARRQSGQTQTLASQASSSGLTAAQAEKVLENMEQEGWFELSKRGFYTLTPRALMELRGWLIETYNDDASDEEEDEVEAEPRQRIKLCQACKEIVTIGQRCPNVVCSARLHDGCVRNMFRAQGGSEQCPLCKTAWVEAPAVGEKAAKASRASNGNRRSSANGVSQGRRGGGAMGMDGAADGESDAEEGASE